MVFFFSSSLLVIFVMPKLPNEECFLFVFVLHDQLACKKKKEKIFKKVVLFLHKNNNVEKTPRTKREHKSGVGDHRIGRGYFESELNVRTVQEYTQRGEHGGMFFIIVF